MPGSRLDQKVEGEGLKIGIVGFGEAGVELTTQLIDKHSKAISKIYVNRRNQQAAETLIESVVSEHIKNHPEKERLKKLVEPADYGTIAGNTDITFFTYGKSGLDPQDRCEPFNINIESFYTPVGGDPKSSIAECFKNYKGLVIVYTNPPDYLCYFFMKELNLEPNQILGFCPDTNRLADRCKEELKKDFVTPEISEFLRDKTQKERDAIIESEIERAASTIMWLGPHGGNERVPIFSPVTVFGSSKKDKLKDRSATMFGEIKGRIYDIISELGMTTREVVPYIVNSIMPAIINAKPEKEIDPNDDIGCKIQKFFVMSAYHKLADDKDLFYGLPIVFYKEERKENGKKKSRIRTKIVKLYRGKDGLFSLDRLDRDEQEKVNEGMKKVRNTLEEAIKIGEDYGLGMPKMRERCALAVPLWDSKFFVIGRKITEIHLCDEFIYNLMPAGDDVLFCVEKDGQGLLQKINFYTGRKVSIPVQLKGGVSASYFDGENIYVALNNRVVQIFDGELHQKASVQLTFSTYAIFAQEGIIYLGTAKGIDGFYKNSLLAKNPCLEKILEFKFEEKVSKIRGVPNMPLIVALTDPRRKGFNLRIFDIKTGQEVAKAVTSARDFDLMPENNGLSVYYPRSDGLCKLFYDGKIANERPFLSLTGISNIAIDKNTLYVVSGKQSYEISLQDVVLKNALKAIPIGEIKYLRSHILEQASGIFKLVPANFLIPPNQ